MFSSGCFGRFDYPIFKRREDILVIFLKKEEVLSFLSFVDFQSEEKCKLNYPIFIKYISNYPLLLQVFKDLFHMSVYLEIKRMF